MHHIKLSRNFYVVVGALASVIIIANVVSIFTDPSADISFIYPQNHTVARDQNSYYLLESASLSPNVMTTDYEHPTVDPEATKLLTGNITGIAWDQAKATKLLDENAKSIKKFQAASTLSGYQIPGLENPATRQSIQNFNIPWVQNHTILNQLNLLAATNSNDPQQQADIALMSLRVARQIAASNQPYIGGIVATKLQIAIVQYLNSHTFPATVQAQIISALPSTHEIWQNARTSMRTEAILHLSNLPNLYSQGNPFSVSLYPPFNYQPDRTASMIASNYQKTISLPDGDCGSAETPDYSSFPNLLSLVEFNGVGKMFARFSEVSFDYKYQCSLKDEIQKLTAK